MLNRRSSRYAQNLFTYWWRDTVEKLVLGGKLRDTPYFSWRDSVQLKWNPSNNTANNHQHTFENPNLQGLYIIKGLLDKESLSAIQDLIIGACGDPYINKQLHLFDKTRTMPHDYQKYSNTSFPWYEYDPSRYAAGWLPYRHNYYPPEERCSNKSDEVGDVNMTRSGNGMNHDILMSSLADFEVFGKVPPSQWLDLNVLCQVAKGNNNNGFSTTDNNITQRFSNIEKGARVLRDLQFNIPKPLPIPSFHDEDNDTSSINKDLRSPSSTAAKLMHSPHSPSAATVPPTAITITDKYLQCIFLQFQYMEGGVSIRPHIDADEPPADLIATLTILGSSKNIIRVGNIDVTVDEGDVYCLTGFARHCVKHEILPSSSIMGDGGGDGDRLTVTLRYVHTDSFYRQVELKPILPENVPL